jgi:AcrR family transcriptional regulator
VTQAGQAGHDKRERKGARSRRAGRVGRRAGESGTKDAIAEAARAQFSELGYHGATIRGIAAVAEVDPALVHHFYGTKEALFAAAMKIPVVPSEVLTAALSPAGGGSGSLVSEPGFGAHLVRTALTLWESDQLRETFIGLIRSAVTSEQAALMLREFIADSILGTISRMAGLDVRGSAAEAEYRAAMVATQMLGLALTRLVLRLPAVAGASVDELAATVGPSVERYLTGEIVLPHGSGSRTHDRA